METWEKFRPKTFLLFFLWIAFGRCWSLRRGMGAKQAKQLNGWRVVDCFFFRRVNCFIGREIPETETHCGCVSYCIVDLIAGNSLFFVDYIPEGCLDDAESSTVASGRERKLGG